METERRGRIRTSKRLIPARFLCGPLWSSVPSVLSFSEFNTEHTEKSHREHREKGIDIGKSKMD
jgi:hypothetical protein